MSHDDVDLMILAACTSCWSGVETKDLGQIGKDQHLAQSVRCGSNSAFTYEEHKETHLKCIFYDGKSYFGTREEARWYVA